MNPHKIKVVKQININGMLFSKAEKAASAYTNLQCTAWWHGYLYKAHSILGGRLYVADANVTILHERMTRMHRRVLPIFKKMLA